MRLLIAVGLMVSMGVPGCTINTGIIQDWKAWKRHQREVPPAGFPAEGEAPRKAAPPKDKNAPAPAASPEETPPVEPTETPEDSSTPSPEPDSDSTVPA